MYRLMSCDHNRRMSCPMAKRVEETKAQDVASNVTRQAPMSAPLSHCPMAKLNAIRETKDENEAVDIIPSCPIKKDKEDNNNDAGEKNKAEARHEKATEIVHGMLDKMAAATIKGESEETSRHTFEQIERITAEQREILKNTFANMEKDAVKNGLEILIQLFSEFPRYKLIWPQFRAIPDSALMHAVELRRHSSVYMCGLHNIIYSMHDFEEMGRQLNRIALAHIKWNIHRKHIMDMLEPVLDCVKAKNEGKLDAATKEAWTTLYDVIANLIEIYRVKQAPIQHR